MDQSRTPIEHLSRPRVAEEADEENNRIPFMAVGEVDILSWARVRIVRSKLYKLRWY